LIKIICALALSVTATAGLADDGFSFYGGVSKSIASGDFDGGRYTRSDFEGEPSGYFVGVDYDRNRYFIGLEINVLQPHCDYGDNSCGNDNLQGIHRVGYNYYNFVDLMDIKVRLGTNLGNDSTKIYGIAGLSTGLWSDDSSSWDAAEGTLFGFGAEYEIYQGLTIGGELIRRSSTAGSELDFGLNTTQIRMLYRY
jgi:hypothetical protein